MERKTPVLFKVPQALRQPSVLALFKHRAQKQRDVTTMNPAQSTDYSTHIKYHTPGQYVVNVMFIVMGIIKTCNIEP